MNFTWQKRANRKVKHKAHVNKIITFNRTRTICHFQKYEVMTMSVVGGQPKNMKIPFIKQQKHQTHVFHL